MAEFQIISAAKKGFIQTWNDRIELVKKSVPSYLIHVVAFYLISQNVILKMDETTKQLQVETLRGFALYSGVGLLLVGMAVLSYIFIYQARLVLLKEKKIPKTESKRKSVIRTYSYAIAFFIAVFLFKEAVNQGSMVITHLLKGVNSFYLITFGLVNALVSIWLMRLSVAHIPLAIDYPVKDFLKTVRGFQFSFYLIGLFIVTLIPISIASLISMALIVQIFSFISQTVVDYAIIIFAAAFYLAGFLILNNASIYALDEVMKNKAKETE